MRQLVGDRQYNTTTEDRAIASANHCFTETHRRFCKTLNDHAVLNHLVTGVSSSEAGRLSGLGESTGRRIASRLRDAGLAHGFDADEERPNPPTIHPLERVTTQVAFKDETGAVKERVWLKEKVEASKVEAYLRMVAEELASDMPRAAIVDPRAALAASRDGVDARYKLNTHVLTDYHLGVVIWGEEAGANWDTRKAVDFLLKWFKVAIEQAPVARVGTLMQLGDFMHFDSLLAQTPASGHIVDSDTRYGLIVRMAIKCMRAIVKMMLQKYPEVRIIAAEGNHDPVGSVWMREMLADHYENEPRVTVETSPSPYGCMTHGRCFLGWHHGHLKRPGDIDRVFAADFPEQYAATKWRTIHMGHLHHEKVMKRAEGELFVVEQHPTVIPKDAYAARHGFRSNRSAVVVTLDERFGETDRKRWTPEMVAAL